jgi:hypothetical protein
MATVPVQTQTRKAPKAFYAHLFDTSGALVKVHGILYFVGDDAAIVQVEPSMINWLTVLGEMTIADSQRLADLMAGDAVGIACSRLMEVR